MWVFSKNKTISNPSAWVFSGDQSHVMNRFAKNISRVKVILYNFFKICEKDGDTGNTYIIYFKCDEYG